MTNKPCVYCGNNPVPHFLTWYFETVDLLFQPVRRLVFFNPLSRFLARHLFSGNFGFAMAKFLIKIGVLKTQPNIGDCKVRRAQVLWEEASRRGIKFIGLKIFGKDLDMYLAEKDGRRLFIDGLPRPQNYDDVVLEVLDDKLFLKAKLRQAGLPVPAGGSAFSLSSALKIFRSIDKPVIVKPRAGSRGRHTTTFIRTEDELRRAFKIAKQLCSFVIVEEQLFGPVYRGTVIGGKLAGVLRGDPPGVTGDGQSTISQLIDIKNSQLRPRVKKISADKETENFLSRQNLKLSSVPLAGQTISLSEKVGLSYGGSSSEDFDICHEDNKQLFLDAAKVVGDPLIGFDFIIADITKSWKNQKCGFIEANSLPFINLHHDPLLGTPRNAAALVWDMMGM